MPLLLDENLPKRFKEDFKEHQVFTVNERGWRGLKNGALLKELLKNNFDALLTFDKNLQHQQNFEKYPIAVFVMTARINTYSELTKLSAKILSLLEYPLPIGSIEIKE
jgi:hypothetical protein